MGEPMSVEWRPTINGSPPPFIISTSGGYNERGKFFRNVACRWPDELYVVSLLYEDSRCVSIEVFALPNAPTNYAAKTLPGQLAAKRRTERLDEKLRVAALARRGIPYVAESKGSDSPAQSGYLVDFLEVITGDAEEELGFEYRRIYAAPAEDFNQ
jgi:hypothetical protein